MESMLQAVYEGARSAAARRTTMEANESMAGGNGGGGGGHEQWKSTTTTEVDEHLARVGYNVRASELPHIAQQIEVLDSLIGAAPESLLGGVSQDTVHYNPSDLASWVECLLDELGPLPASMATTTTTTSMVRAESESSSVVTNSQHFGFAPQPQQQQQVLYNDLQSPPSSSSAVLQSMPSMAMPPTTTEELGVQLVHLLLACADAVQRREIPAAGDMARKLRSMLAGGAADSSGAMGRVAAHFVEGLCRRIFGGGGVGLGGIPGLDITGVSSATVDEILHFHYYETCPYLKFAHFTANQAILEAFEGQSQVHVVDFNLEYGLQWPALIQALALRPGGPPQLRLTGIGPPQPGGKDLLQEIGLKLAQMAESVNVEFTFHGVVAARLEDVRPWMLTCRSGEAVAVNSVFQLHATLLDGEGAAGSSPVAPSPVTEVLRWVRGLNPRIVTVVEQDADHNGVDFLDRFMAALHYYSTMFDSLEACNLAAGSLEQVVAEAYLGREVVDIVAADGPERRERHETLEQWRSRMISAGFQPLFLGSNAFRQASMLLTLFSGDGYRVVENGGCLTLGWHSRSLIAASAWRCS
uniref:DELLA protein n=1 Tax=Selaginella kraussiana TaxID=81964 RepID=A7U4T5_9TRAC|nr:DELLA protein [Selaginella kraussiana]